MPRIIYSLEFDLGQTPNGEFIQLIAPLDQHGQSPHCKAMPPKKRVIDLRIGDYIWHRSKRYRIRGIKAYRDNYVDKGRLKCDPPTDGYVVKGS